MKKISWSDFKDFVDDRSLSIQYEQTTDTYDLSAYDGPHGFKCDLTRPSTDATDFETNYKADGNKPLIERDSEGHEQVKQVIALDSMHYEPRSLDFVTSKYKSLYNRKHDGAGINDGTDYGDGVLKFYDSSDNELSYQQTGYESETESEFQARLTSGCVKTFLEYTPDFDYAIRSGTFMLREEVDYDAYFWCILAPHIPAAIGGQAPFLAGGYNLSFFPAKSYITMDGQTTFVINKDTTYYSHRIGLYVKHNAGDEIGIQMIYEHYKE